MINNGIQISDIGMLCSGEGQIKTIYLNINKSQKIFSMTKFLWSFERLYIVIDWLM